MAGSDVRSETRSRLSQYKPGSFRNLQGHRFTKVSIQLFGMAGQGKSSLINSCLCVMGDEAYLNVAGSGGGNPNTMVRKEYRLLDNVYITDNRGVVTLNLEELHEMTAQMGQLRVMGDVEWGRSIDKSTEVLLDNFRNPPSGILLPVFVYSAAYGWTPKRSQELMPFLERANSIAGIFPVIALTRCDNPNSGEVQKQFRQLGANFVIPIENYTSRNNVRNPETDENVLKLLDVCLKEADRSISLKMHEDPKAQFLQQVMKQIESEMKDKDEEIRYLTSSLEKKKPWWRF